VTNYIDIVLSEDDGDQIKFVEIEDGQGRSIAVGQWITTEGHIHLLRIPDPRELIRERDAARERIAVLETALRSIDQSTRFGDNDDILAEIARARPLLSRAETQADAVRKAGLDMLSTLFQRAPEIFGKLDGQARDPSLITKKQAMHALRAEIQGMTIAAMSGQPPAPPR